MGAGQSKKTLDDQLRENKRFINSAIRELDRERTKLEQSEQKLIQEIKKSAAANQISSVKIMAKDLVRTKNYKHKFYEMRSQLQGVNLRLQTVKSTQAMSESMKGVAQVMVRMNKQMNLPSMHKIMQDFIKENDKLGLTEEMMGDVIDMAMSDETDEQEEERVVASVLEEIGLDMSQILSAAPSGAPVNKNAAATTAPAAPQAVGVGGGQTGPKGPASSGAAGGSMEEVDKSLEERLNNLRK